MCPKPWVKSWRLSRAKLLMHVLDLENACVHAESLIDLRCCGNATWPHCCSVAQDPPPWVGRRDVFRGGSSVPVPHLNYIIDRDAGLGSLTRGTSTK